ncbi:MAG: signal peptidase II [Clostridia bacterium]|nr:signal peptidase II [Clostridia bacterium]
MTIVYGEIDLKLNRWVKYSLWGMLAVALTVIDQLSKMWMVNASGGVEGKGFIIIKNVLNFTYLKNYGASMGLFSGQRIALICVTVLVFAFGIYYFIKHRPENTLFLAAVSLVASGAVGNLIDRVFLGYVRDFIDVQFINFYIFNFADCVICIGAGLLMLYAFLNVRD